ncbi:hypothetical protein LZD49_12545 [Dyadobacter sp. CY261]|uniref:hypothetical protein n=1 Tax=Dyadobacter sp. CY261 TaxID=2907203 RepID=UPI001F1F2CD9|nr:hypothetical protein [Dyadobacter sp. CY261]MCF0071302.1 hypothetical protein [Dyadobacter sp. CY261]
MSFKVKIEIPVAWDCEDIQKILSEIQLKLISDTKQIKKLKRWQEYISDYQSAEVRIEKTTDF